VKLTKKDIRRTLDIMNNNFSSNKITLLNDGGIYNYTIKLNDSTCFLKEQLENVRIKGILRNNIESLGLNPEDPNDDFDALRYAISYYFMVDDSINQD